MTARNRRKRSDTSTVTSPTAFMYLRVSTPAQEVDEQIKIIRQYASDKGVKIIAEYGDTNKRHKALNRKSFQSMLLEIEKLRPNLILVQRLDRFGTANPNELGYFLTLLDQKGVRLITVIDGKDCSKIDLSTIINNTISASQSRQEQIDKAERVLVGKRRKAELGEYIGTKSLVYGFDLVCLGHDGSEKWRMVEDSCNCRVKYRPDKTGNYVECERFSNEVIKDPHGIMPDKVIRHRPSKDTSDRLVYSPSIRSERVETIRRICDWFLNGWTTYKIAQQLNSEGIKPVYSDRWYPTLIDGLLQNSVIIGKPAWNRSSQSHFRHIEADKIIETDDADKGQFRLNEKTEWVMPTSKIFDPCIENELFDRIQKRMEQRHLVSPQRSPRNENLWLGGLWIDAETKLKFSGNSQGKHFRLNHPDHFLKRLSFQEAEWFIGEYLRRVGHRLESLGESEEDKNVLERLNNDEFMKEIQLEFIRLEVESYLENKLQHGFNMVGGAKIIMDYDDDKKAFFVSDNSLLEVYCAIVKENMKMNQQDVQEKMEEQKRLVNELMMLKNKEQVIIDTYNERIAMLGKEIAEATSAPDYMEWWQQVWQEIQLLREQQNKVEQAIQQGSYLRKGEAIRSMIESIECHWATIPTTDGRYKSGKKTYCRAVTIKSKSDLSTKDGQPIKPLTIDAKSIQPKQTMTNATSSQWSSYSHGFSIRWVLAHPRQFVQGLLSMTIERPA